nr:fibroblast growth factor 1-like [Leptinotarsa decemlineata]
MKNEACAESDSSSDDSSDTDSSGDEGDFPQNRQKRAIEWCGVDTENNDYYRPPQLLPEPRPPSRRKVVLWPPPSTSSSASHNHFGNAREGNPKLGAKMQLFSKTGYHLAVYPDGKVRGTLDENDIHTYLEIVSAGYPGHIKIRGLLTNLYIAMNRKGRIYGDADPMEESTVFLESFRGLYNVYLSRKYAHVGWYIALKKNGRPKRGPKTGVRQKAVQFLPRRSKFE